MTLKNPKVYYSRFLAAHQGKFHFAAHSHHFWPDVTREAQLAYWDDCAQLSDQKWTKIFGEVIPEAQKHIAGILKIKDAGQIVFAPNTHELTSRLLSLFLGKSELKILTTASEFHSWRRQILRLEEIASVSVEVVATDNLLTAKKDFLDDIKNKLKKSPDIFFISQVFFDSGIALTDQELLELCQAKPERTLMVVDGYHGFAAIPTDLSQLEGKIFYLSGGYKYAQAGEGVGFMLVPKGNWRPAYTGWYAEMGELSQPADKKVGYPNDGLSFMGATQDPSGLYRFNAVWGLLTKDGWSIERVHQHVTTLQKQFIADLPKELLTVCKIKPLYDENLTWHGHFLTFEASSIEAAEKLQDQLKNLQVLIDRRGSRIRFGFGLYHSAEDVGQLVLRLSYLMFEYQ